MNAGKIRVSSDLILKWLDLNDGGKIIGVTYDPSYAGSYVDIFIEHPDLPALQEGETIPDYSPIYITTTDALGHSVTVRQR